MHYWYDGWHIGWMIVWWILGLAAIATLVWVLLNGMRHTGPSGESPEDILRRRYAKGEIDKEEFDRRLEDLRR